MAPPVIADNLALQPFDLTRDCMPGLSCSSPTYYYISGLTDPDSKAEWRNRFQDYLLWRSDRMCNRYKSELIADQFGTNFFLDTVTQVTSGIGAFVLAPAANVLSGVAAISTGTRANFNSDFYQKTLAPALIKEIDGTRESYLAKIMSHRSPREDEDAAKDVKSKIVPMEKYTLEAAIGDVERYQRLCSAAVALGTLVSGDKTTAAAKPSTDTAEGIRYHIAMLREQQVLNEKRATSVDKPEKDQLLKTNADLASTIRKLQLKLASVSLTGG